MADLHCRIRYNIFKHPVYDSSPLPYMGMHPLISPKFRDLSEIL